MDDAGAGRPEPVAGTSGVHEERRARAAGVLAGGTFACPACDLPLQPHRPLGPAEAVRCPMCDHGGHVRDFLSLTAPSRPARVVVVVR